MQYNNSRQFRKINAAFLVQRRSMKDKEDMGNTQEKAGWYGEYGGYFVPETLMGSLTSLARAYEQVRGDKEFYIQLQKLFHDYAGRPSALYYAENLSRSLGGAKIYLKREDLNHTGSHKINNAIGQALLASRMGKTRIITATSSGESGVATASAASLFSMQCDVYMGKEDLARNAFNASRMKLLGALVHPVDEGSGKFPSALAQAFSDLAVNEKDTYLALGSAIGPHPYPMIVRDFQSIISREAKEQLLRAENRLPAAVAASVGGGANALGMFYHFVLESGVNLVCVEAAGKAGEPAAHAASLSYGKSGVFNGMKSLFLQAPGGRLGASYSIASGLDYPGSSPELAYLKEAGRVGFAMVSDEEAVDAYLALSRSEGVLASLEACHALAFAMQLAKETPSYQSILVCLSGRGEKDMQAVLEHMGEKNSGFEI